MEVIENHPYLNQTRLRPKKIKILIVGTFPAWEFTENPRPHFDSKIMFDVPYGRVRGKGRNYFWELLFTCFGLSAPGSIDEIYEFLHQHQIGLTDVYKRVVRKIPKNSSDSNLKIIEKNDLEIISIVKDNPKIKILCTSKLAMRELPLEVKDRVEVEVLPSPSGSASRSIGGLDEYKSLKKLQPNFSTIEYRLDCYKKAITPMYF